MATLQLTQGKVALLDLERLEEVLAQGSWHAVNVGRGRFYAATRIGGRRVYLHRFLMQAPPKLEVDHINNDGLDNRAANLRVCTHAQNLANQRAQVNNTSGFKGVVLHQGRPAHRCWQARLEHDGRRRSYGYYASPEAAARAYDKAATETWGEFAHLNFPPVEV